MLVYDYKLLQIGRLQQFIRINNVGVKWGGVSRQRTRQLPQELGKHQHQTNWCQIRILSTTRLSGTMIWWWNFPKIHLAPNHKHQEITSGAQVEKYHFPTQMLECQDAQLIVALKAQQASVCVNLGLLSITIVPTSQQEKTAMWQNAISRSVLEATLLDLPLSTASSAATYLRHRYYHTVATLEIKLPVRKGASCILVKFPSLCKVKLHKIFSKASSFSLETQTPVVTQWSTVTLTKWMRIATSNEK